MASDNFTNDDGTGLEVHDANWTSIGGVHVVTNLEINNNVVEHEGIWDISGAYYDGSSEDFCQIVDKAHYEVNKHAAVRAGANQRGYAVHLSVVEEGNWMSFKVTKNGIFLAELEGYGDWSQEEDHVIKITASGTTTVTIEGFVDGIFQGTVEDSDSPLGSGHPGFWTDDAEYTEDSQWDDWTDGVEAGETFYQNAGQGVVAIAGSLVTVVTFVKAVGGHAMTIVGTLVKKTSKGVGGHAMTIVGTLVKKTSKGVGDGQVLPTGILSKKTFKDVGGGSVTSIGALAITLSFTQAVGGASMSIIGSLATRFIARIVGANFLRRRKTFYKQ